MLRSARDGEKPCAAAVEEEEEEGMPSSWVTPCSGGRTSASGAEDEHGALLSLLPLADRLLQLES